MFHIKNSQVYDKEAKSFNNRRDEVVRNHQPTSWTKLQASAGIFGDGGVTKSYQGAEVSFGSYFFTQSATSLVQTANFVSHLEYTLECFVQILKLA